MSYTYAGCYSANQIVDSAGTPLPSVQVTVYDHSTNTLATLYTDRTKSTQASNPVSTDSSGNLTFYADPGQYDLSPAGYSNRATVEITIDPSELGGYEGVLAPSGDTSGATDVTRLQAALNAGDVTLEQGGKYYWNSQITQPASTQLNLNGATVTLTSALTASALKGAAAVHEASAVLGPGTIDATAVTSNTVTAVIDFGSVTSCPNLRIAGVRVVNAPTHGIFVSEATHTTAPKWVTGNSVEGYHKVSGGYGIYADYVGNILIGWNHVEGGSGDDAIELGHSGQQYLGIEAHMVCFANTVKDGEINFPFSHGAQIVNNQVDVSGYAGLGGIGNDSNTANNVLIQGNTVRGASLTSQSFAAVWITGDSGKILNNDIQVTANSCIAIQGFSQILTNGEIAGNICSTTAALGGAAIGTGSASSTNLDVHDNHIIGNFNTGVQIQNPTVHLHHNTFAQSSGASAPWGVASGLTGAPILIESNVIVGSPGYTYPKGYIQSTAGLIIRDNYGVNPFGSETVAIPASGTAVAAAYYDRTFYVTAAAGGVTMAIQGGPTVSVPASGLGTIHVPAGLTVTPTYTTAPTWVVEGE